MQGCALILVLALDVVVQLRAQHRHVILASLHNSENEEAHTQLHASRTARSPRVVCPLLSQPQQQWCGQQHTACLPAPLCSSVRVCERCEEGWWGQTQAPCTYRDELLPALLQRLSPLLQQLSQGLHIPSISSFMDDAVQQEQRQRHSEGGMRMQGACWAAVGVWWDRQGLTIGHQGRQWTYQSTLLVLLLLLLAVFRCVRAGRESVGCREKLLGCWYYDSGGGAPS